MRRSLPALVAVALFGVIVGGASCGDDSETGTSGTTQSTTTGTGTPTSSSSGMNGVVSKEITAAEGGTVETAGASLAIPAGALAEDTTITVETLDAAGQPDAESIASAVYDFGPDGTTFTMPVELTLDFTGSAPEGTEAKLAFLDGDTWTVLPDSAVSGQSVTATTTHFTLFAVLFVSGSGQVEGGCSDTPFTACGGDPTGVYSITAACVDIPDPFMGQCVGASIGAAIDFQGDVTFGDAGEFEVTGTATQVVDFFIPSACIGGQPCSEVDEDFMEVEGGCSQHAENTTQVNDVGTYTVSGNQIIVTETDGDVKTYDFCVDGDSLQLSQVPDADDDPDHFIITLTKQ